MSSTTPTAAPATPADSEEPPAQGASWNASGPSSGVDRADWPPTAKGARALLARLPKTLDGESLELDSDGTAAVYGTLGEVFVQMEEDQDGPDRLTSRQLLMAGFGLGAVCAGKTYRGTAAMPVLREGEQEGALSQAAPGVEAGSTPAWFSCRPVMEDEQWGHAVGWTSGTTAWILYARDDKAARSFVSALHAAAR